VSVNKECEHMCHEDDEIYNSLMFKNSHERSYGHVDIEFFNSMFIRDF
jgi:hypothetical protein